MDHELASLLARWHQWRARYSASRGFARPRLLMPEVWADDEDFEQMLMVALDEAIDCLSREEQLAIQHVARAECLGVEVLTVHALMNHERRNTAIAKAVDRLRLRLTRAGIL